MVVVDIEMVICKFRTRNVAIYVLSRLNIIQIHWLSYRQVATICDVEGGSVWILGAENY